MGGNHSCKQSQSIMRLYVFVMSILTYTFWNHKDCLLWIYGMSIFFVIKYAKDFIDQRLR
jgi:hypothetical protein